MLREKTNRVRIRDRWLGGSNEILIQTMADIKTSRVEDILAQATDLAERGADLYRVSVLDNDDLKALPDIAAHAPLPVVADIHYSAEYALGAIRAQVDKIRINPGNMKPAELTAVIREARRYQIPIRIGVNSGSLDRLNQLDRSCLDSYFQNLDRTIKLFKDEGYADNLVLSLKASDPDLTYRLYRAAAEIYPYPLHVGVTESGFGVQGMARSLAGLVPILREGIGNTIRISLTDSPQEEIEACKALLKALGLREQVPTLISCPTCGRTQAPVSQTARRVKEMLSKVQKNVKVAVMGCPVNGPGEAKDADFGLAGTVEAFLVFKKGQRVGLMSESEALAWLAAQIEIF